MTTFTLRVSSLLILACALAISTTTAFQSPAVNVARTGSFTKPALMRVQTPRAAFIKSTSSTTSTSMSSDESSETESTESKSNLPFFLDVGTKGGAVFVATAAFIVPIIGYNIAVEGFGVDGIEAGRWIGIGFTVVACLGWASTYVFRVATKDMTYAKQLKDYENAVIAKRMEELDEDELQALVEEVERDDF